MLPFEDCIQAGISVFNNLLLYPGLAPSVGLMVTVFCRGQHQMRSYSVLSNLILTFSLGLEINQV